MILAGLRVGELTALRWRDVDLASARLNVAESKTDAGRRTVGVTPWLLDELKANKASSRYSAPDELVFCTGKGIPFNRSNVRQRILGGAIAAANNKLRRRSSEPLICGGDHEPDLPADIRLAALRGRRLACVCDGADGTHELGAGARGLCPQDGPPARDGSAHGRADPRRRLDTNGH